MPRALFCVFALSCAENGLFRIEFFRRLFLFFNYAVPKSKKVNAWRPGPFFFFFFKYIFWSWRTNMLTRIEPTYKTPLKSRKSVFTPIKSTLLVLEPIKYSLVNMFLPTNTNQNRTKNMISNTTITKWKISISQLNRVWRKWNTRFYNTTIIFGFFFWSWNSIYKEHVSNQPPTIEERKSWSPMSSYNCTTTYKLTWNGMSSYTHMHTRVYICFANHDVMCWYREIFSLTRGLHCVC